MSENTPLDSIRDKFQRNDITIPIIRRRPFRVPPGASGCREEPIWPDSDDRVGPSDSTLFGAALHSELTSRREKSSCERVLGTPVPLSYSRHTSRFLTLWAATLPLVLVRDDEKMFAASQIKEANAKIKKLRKIVLKLHAEKEESTKNFAERITKQMVENATLKAKLENT